VATTHCSIVNGAILVVAVSDQGSVFEDKLVQRATDASRDERNERLMWLYTMNEYISTRGTNSQIEDAMRKHNMCQWDGSPSKDDFRKIFHIAIAALRKDVESKLITPLEKTLDKEEASKLRVQREAALVKKKAGRKRNGS